MNELINVRNESGELLVSARELHKGLEVKSRFNDWINNRIKKYDLIEDIDYTKILVECNRGQNVYDFVLKIDCAKELSMVENNEKGKQIRRYFIECEKKLKQVALPSYQIQDPIERAKVWIKEQEERQKLALEIEIQKPKVEYHDTVLKSQKLISTTDVAKDLGMSARKLNEKLNELKVIYKQSNTWKLYSKHQDKVPEYCDYHINEFGQILKWTEKGRKWIIELLSK